MQLVVALLFALCAAAQARPEANVGVHDVFPGVGEYYFNGIPANWSTAFRQCQASGGHLTVINSVEEKEALQEMLTRHGANSVLVGFHDQFIEGVYTFITGRSLGTSDGLWAPGFPVGSDASYDCGYLNADGIFDGSCAELSPFICELSEDQGGEDNSDGFTLLEGFGYYKLHDDAYWPDAWQTCREERSDLLVLDSEAELDALYSISNGYLWLGVHRKWGPDDAFVSVNNTPLSEIGYQKWNDVAEPRGSFESNPYLMLYGRNGMGSQTANWKFMFYCKRPL